MACIDEHQTTLFCNVADILALFWARVDRILPAPPADLFTQDGILLLGTVEAHGRVEIEAYFAARYRAQAEMSRHTRHILTNLRIEEQNGETIEAHSMITVYAGVGPLPLASLPTLTIADFSYKFSVEDRALRLSSVQAQAVFRIDGAANSTVKSGASRMP